MSQVRYHPLGPLLAGEGSRAFLGLALEEGVPPRPVVLVWAPPEVARDPELSAALQRETQHAAILEHPNILRVHGLVSLEAGLARVTEFADGESLRRLLEVRPRIPPAFGALIAADVAMGVHYAHLAGNDDGTPLVHGDLRPETVMVSFNGVCKVTGYGALSVAPRERNGRRVRNRRNYSAPEQLIGGREAITTRTDVFLLGLLLYECLSGRMPFQDTPDADQAAIDRQLPPLPSDVPRPLAEVVRHATAKRANERYATALEFREAVVAAIAGLPSAETFAEFLSTLFPPDRDARATRRQLLEIGLADMARRAPPAPARPPGVPTVPPARPAGHASTVPIANAETVSDIDVPLRDEDVDAIDSVMELTGQHARPGVARPLPRGEPKQVEVDVEVDVEMEEEEEEEDEALPPKRRSRVPLLAGALAATAAAVGGFFVWSEHSRASRGAADTDVPPVAQAAPPAPPAPALPESVGDGGLAQAAPGAAEVPPDTAQPAPAGDDTAPSGEGSAPSVVVAGGVSPASPAGSVVPASTTAPAPSSSGSQNAPEAPATERAAVATRLHLIVLPPVEVSLGGQRLGRTPLTVPLAPGPYELELSNPAKGVWTTRSVTVGPQGTTTQRLLLGKGTVLIQAPAGSRVFLNGRKAGLKLSLYEGEHQLVVTTGSARWEKSFRLEPNQRVTFTVDYDEP